MSARCLPGVMLGVVLCFVGAERGAAQSSALSLDARAGASLPVASFGDEAGGLSVGPSVGLGLVYVLGPRSGVRLGFSQERFGCGSDACAAGDELVYTGWEVGGRFVLTTAFPRPWIRLSALFSRVESHEMIGNGERLSDLSAGFDAGFGVEVSVGSRASITPAVRYAWLDTRFPGRRLLRMRWVVVDLGIGVAL